MEKDYKKLYEDSLARMQRAFNTNRCTIGFMNEVFPETKESEDEKVRRFLVKWVKERMLVKPYDNDGFDKETVLAWLEKQGEPIDNIVKRATTDKQRVLLTETNGDANIDWDTRSLQDVKLLLEYGLGYIKKLEKQGSQILANSTKTCKNEQKSVNKVEPKFKVKYAGSEYNVFETKDIAGVTFYGIEDEPNHIDYVKADNCEIISGGYGIKENGSPYPTKPAVFSEQNPAWSEEDEDMCYKAIAVINRLCAEGKDYVWSIKTLKKLFYWLKSLRPQNQQESIEDKVNNFFDALGDCSYMQDEILRLKSIWKQAGLPQPQNHWKPSDEHIKVCKEVYADILSSKGFDLGTVNSELNRLEEQLKKL